VSETKSERSGCRTPVLGCLFVVFLVAIAVSLWVRQDAQRGWTVARLEHLIEVEVPADCDREQAEVWFERHGIQHSYFTDTTGDRSGQRTMPMLANLRDEDLSGMVRGWIEWPEANVGFRSSGRIQIYFFFDKEGRRIGHLVHPVVYSL